MSRFAALRARADDTPLKPDPAVEPDDDDDETLPEPDAGEEEENDMTDTTKTNSEPKADAIDYKARMQAVFAAAETKGKESLAAEILADAAFDSLTADAVIKLVGKTEVGTKPQADDDDKEFRDAALKGMDAKVENLGEGGKPEPEAANNFGWDDIHAEVRQARGA